MVKIMRYPLDAATAASPMPVLPLVGSIITDSGLSRPFSSASSIIAFAILSFTLPAGLKYSSFAKIFADKLFSFSKLFSSKRGVPPISSVIRSNVFITISSFKYSIKSCYFY